MLVILTVVKNVRTDVEKLMVCLLRFMIGVGQWMDQLGIIVPLKIMVIKIVWHIIFSLNHLSKNLFTYIDPCVEWPENYFIKNDEPNSTLVKELYEYGRHNLALIHVMIQSPYVTKIKREVAMTFTGFVSNTGGLLGLCIGFSFISAIEIFFWICCSCKGFNK